MSHALVVFKGFFTTLQPVSFSTHDKSGKDKFALPRLGDQLYLPASGIRGAIRRAMYRVVEDFVIARGQRFSLKDCMMLAQGGIVVAKKKAASRDAEAGDDAEEGDSEGKAADDTMGDTRNVAIYVRTNRFAAARNPLLALCGSMEYGIPGHWSCSHALASREVEPVRVHSVRANEFLRNPSSLNQLAPAALEDAERWQNQAAAHAACKNRVEELTLELRRLGKKGDPTRAEEIRSEIKRVEAEDPGIVHIAQLLTHECIPPGTVFEHEFVLRGASDLELALLLAGLDAFAQEPYLGGRRNHDYGLVSGSWAVSRRGKYGEPLADFGRVSFAGDFRGLTLEGPITAANTWSSSPERDGCDFTALALTRAGRGEVPGGRHGEVGRHD